MTAAPTRTDVNGLITTLAAKRRPLIVSHGGVAVGSVPPNTSLAVRAAFASGADIVKLDVAASADNVFHLFHDGFEEELLGVSGNIQTRTAAEISELSYRWRDRPGRRARVERLITVLGESKGTERVFALDRSWWRWPTLLKVLDGLAMPEQLMVKVPAWESDALGRLRAHRTPLPVVAICSTLNDCSVVLADPDLNVVAVELITSLADDVWFQPEVLADLRGRGVLTWVNSETLTTGIPLFGGHDDERAVAEGPDAAWSRLFELGVDAIQTEWPWLLRDYRARR